MAITVVCSNCGKKVNANDSLAGKSGLCPYCKHSVNVPIPASANHEQLLKASSQPRSDLPPTEQITPQSTETHISATERQKAYATDLGIEFEEGIDRRELSRLIDSVVDEMPATDKQKQLLRAFSIPFPDDIRRGQIGLLLDHVLELKDRITEVVRTEYDRQVKEAGMLIEHATVDQLLNQLTYQGKFFFALILDGDEFRYHENAPFKGQFVWNDGLGDDDVKYLLKFLNSNWLKNFNSNKYLMEEFSGYSPPIEIAVRVLL